MSNLLPRLTIGLALLALPAISIGAAAQPSAITGMTEATATIETVDQQRRTALLRSPAGTLSTVNLGPEVRNIAQLRPGDQVRLRYTESVAAQIVRPGDPQPESTTSTSRSNPGDRPGGQAVSNLRERVTIEGINLANNSVAFVTADRVPRNAIVQQPAMQAFLRTLKVGDEVEITYSQALAVSVEPMTR